MNNRPLRDIKRKFFWRVGWFYVPVSLGGFVLKFLAVVFCVTALMAIARHSQSTSDTLYGVFPFFACTFDWLTSRTS